MNSKNVTLFVSSADKIKDGLTMYNSTDKQNAIAGDLTKLIEILTSIKKFDINKSFFSNVPVIGSYFDKIKSEHIREKYSNTKVLIDELTLELTKKCSELKQSDLQLDPIIDSLREDIKNNKKEYDRLLELYKEMTGREIKTDDEGTIVIEETDIIGSNKNIEDDIELNSAVTVIASSMKELMSLIKNQTVYLTEMASIKTQNLTFIQNVTTTIKTSVSSIATGLIVANHLSRRNELMEIASACRDIAADMTLNTANAMKTQTETYKNLLIADPIDANKLDKAIETIQITHNSFNEFTRNEMPKIMQKLENSSASITALVHMVDSADKAHKVLLGNGMATKE